jgi:hypothetical protein
VRPLRSMRCSKRAGSCCLSTEQKAGRSAFHTPCDNYGIEARTCLTLTDHDPATSLSKSKARYFLQPRPTCGCRSPP